MCRRITLLRRMSTKHPKHLDTVMRVYGHYLSYDYVGASAQNADDDDLIPAPPLGQGGRPEWNSFFPGYGPIGLLLPQCHANGWAMAAIFSIHQAGEVPLETMEMPVSH